MVSNFVEYPIKIPSGIPINMAKITPAMIRHKLYTKCMAIVSLKMLNKRSAANSGEGTIGR